jgi:hypothetical protein
MSYGLPHTAAGIKIKLKQKKILAPDIFWLSLQQQVSRLSFKKKRSWLLIFFGSQV